MQCLFYVVATTDGNFKVFTRSQDSPATEFSNALVPGKKASKAGRSDCWFLFFYTEILATLNIIFSDVFFAYNAKEIQHR